MAPIHRILRVTGKGLLWLGLLLATSLPAQAASKPEGKGPRPVGAVNSSNGGVYKPGQLGFVLKYFYYDQDQLYQGTDKVDFFPPKPGQKPARKCFQRTVHKSQLTIRAGLLERFDTRLIIPVFDKEMKRSSSTMDFTDDNFGLGDIRLIGRYQLLSQKRDPLNLALGVGLKMPTGETGAEDDKGNCLPGFLQTGSGSWDPFFEVGAHKVVGRHWFSGHLSYLLTTEGELGESDFERPDVFNYNLAYALALHKLVDLQLELNGQVKGMARLDGETVANSGGHIVYLTPGLHFKFYKGMHFGLCVPIAVYHDLNGTQLAENFRIVAKLAIKFNAF